MFCVSVNSGSFGKYKTCGGRPFSIRMMPLNSNATGFRRRTTDDRPRGSVVGGRWSEASPLNETERFALLP